MTNKFCFEADSDDEEVIELPFLRPTDLDQALRLQVKIPNFRKWRTGSLGFWTERLSKRCSRTTVLFSLWLFENLSPKSF